MVQCKCGCGQEVNDEGGFVSIAHRNRYLTNQKDPVVTSRPATGDDFVKEARKTGDGPLVGERFLYIGDSGFCDLKQYEKVVVADQHDDGSVDVRSFFSNRFYEGIPLSYLGDVGEKHGEHLNIDPAASAGFEGGGDEFAQQEAYRISSEENIKVGEGPSKVVVQTDGGEVVSSSRARSFASGVDDRMAPDYVEYADGHKVALSELEKRAYTEMDHNLSDVRSPVRGRGRRGSGPTEAYFNRPEPQVKVGERSYVPPTEDSILSLTRMDVPEEWYGDLEYKGELQEDKMERIRAYQEEISKDGSCPRCKTSADKDFQYKEAMEGDLTYACCGTCGFVFKTAEKYDASDYRKRRSQKLDSMDGIYRNTGFAGNVRSYEKPYGAKNQLEGIEYEDMSVKEIDMKIDKLEKELGLTQKPKGTVEPPSRGE